MTPDDALTDHSTTTPPGYVPSEMTVGEADAYRRRYPEQYQRLALQTMAVHVELMLELRRRGAETFDYGNNIRQRALDQGVRDAFDFPGFVPAYIRPQFCVGRGPFRWAALSGDPEDPHHDERRSGPVPRRRRAAPLAGHRPGSV